MNENDIREKVKKLLFKNMVSGYSKTGDTNFHYTKPSPDTYPYQFFWDTCFHIYILNALDEYEMAKKHIDSLFSLQESNGFIGHMIYWNNILPGRFTDIFQSKPGLKMKLFQSHISALIQPPLIAQAVLNFYDNSKDREFIDHIFPKLKKYFHWLAKNRDFDGSGLLSIISPFESGIDWKPTFDQVVGFPEKKASWQLFWKVVWVDIRNFLNNYNLETIYKKDYFIVKEVGLNTIYIQNLKAMAVLCDIVQNNEGETFRQRAKKAINSLIEIMYDDESAAFLDVYGRNNIKIKTYTPTIFFPVVIKEVHEKISNKVINAHLFNKEEFDVPFPIPSLAVNHPSFDPKRSLFIWRGPTWIFYNWFMHKFFLETGYNEEANKLVVSIKKLIEKSGFREYYNPFTGEGYGAQNFTWSGLVVDMIKMEEKWSVK